MKEEWKDIIGFEGKYQISNLGRVKSLKRKNVTKDKILIQPIKNGYKYVTLYNKNFYIHRLVAEHFIPYIEGKEYVNHLDENKLNNNVTNLEWCTNKENINYSLNKMKVQHIRKTNTGYHHISKDERYYRVSLKHTTKRFKNIEDAIEYRNRILKEY